MRGRSSLAAGDVAITGDLDVSGTTRLAGPIGVGDSLRFGTSLATSCEISSTSGSLLTRVANNALLQNATGATICESRGTDRTTVFFGGVSAPILSASAILIDTITARAGTTVTVASNLQVDDNLAVTADFYAGKVLSPLVQAFAFESDVLRPSLNPGGTVEGDLVVTGNISAPNLNPYHVAGRFNGFNQFVLSTKGKQDFVVQRTGVCFYKCSWTVPHPDGANFTVLCQGEGQPTSAWNVLSNANTTHLANTSTSVSFVVRDNNFASVDGIMNFVVLA